MTLWAAAVVAYFLYRAIRGEGRRFWLSPLFAGAVYMTILFVLVWCLP